MTPLPTLEEIFGQFREDEANALSDDAAPDPTIKAEAAIQRLFAAERLDELNIWLDKALSYDVGLPMKMKNRRAELQQLIEPKDKS